MSKALLLFASILAVAFAANTIDLTTTVRDFDPSSSPDFEHYLGAQSGLVQSTLDQDGKPVYSGSGSVIFSAESFRTWYRDTDGINYDFTRSITLTEDSTRPGVYIYDNQNYFPIDNVGFGNYYNGHNFGFTTEIHTEFTYSGGEYFSFSGDDDVWVFINSRLAVDLGGVHGPESGSVHLDDSASALGLTIGGNYHLDIFQAERHTSGSTFHMETTLELATSDPVLPDPGRAVYICEVVFPNFCAGLPQPAGTLPSRDDSCPADPVLHFGGVAYSMENFNAISFNNFYAPSGDVEGRTAIRNNLNLPQGQYSFGYELRTGGVAAWDASLPYSLVVGHTATWTGDGAIYPDGSNSPYTGSREDIFAGDAFVNDREYLQQRVTGGPCATSGCLDADFDNAQAFYTLLQTSFDGVTDNAQVAIQYGTLTLTCSDANAAAYSVHIDGGDLSGVTSWVVDASCGTDSQIVFNIGGLGSVTFHGDNIYYKQERVLYNVLGSGRTIEIQTEVRGSILAPNNVYHQAGMGVVKGLVIAGDMTQVHQINRVHCVHPAPPPHDNGVCPEWETTCAGLDFALGSEVHSFRDFQVISFGSFVADTGDIEGRLAARYDVTLGAGYSIGYELRTAGNQPDNSLPYSLVTGRDLCWLSGSLHPDGSGIPYAGDNEDAFVGRTVCADTPSYLRAEVTGVCGSAGEGCLESYFTASKSCYVGYQSTLASLSDNVAQTVLWSALQLTCSDNTADQYVVSLTPETMASYTYITVDNCNFQASWVINVRGSGDVYFRGDSFPAIPGGIVYNVLGNGRTIDVTGTAVTGHILSPNNVLHQTGGVIVGKVVVGDITFALQINKYSCPNPGVVTIPSPVVEDSPAGSPSITVASLAFIVGDNLNIDGSAGHIVTGTDGKKITFSPALSHNVAAGAIASADVDGNTGRTLSDSEASSSSIVSVSIALLVAMLALF